MKSSSLLSNLLWVRNWKYGRFVSKYVWIYSHIFILCAHDETELAIASFESVKTILNYYASLLVAMTSLQAPACLADFITSLINFDAFQLMEQINGLLNDVSGVIDDFSEFLLNNAVWRFFIDGLDLILNNVS